MDTLEDIVAKEMPEFISILSELSKQVIDSKGHLKNLYEKVSKEDVEREDGLSFIEMKIHLFLQYLINLTYSMLLKLDGKSFIDQPCIKRLVEIRTVIEKVRPIDKKLNYQIDKLIKMATETDLNKNQQHPLTFKPNLDNLAVKDDESNSEGEQDDSANTGVYVPPRVTAVPYEEDSKLSKMQKKLEKARQKSINTALLDDLRVEYSDAPIEIRDDKNRNKLAKIREKDEERTTFEEDNLRRLTVTKKDKLLKRKMSDLDEVIKLGSFKSLEDNSSDDNDDGKYKPKGKKKKGKAGKGKFKKRMQRKGR